MVKRLCLSDPASKWHGWDSSQGLSASLVAPWFGEGRVGAMEVGQSGEGGRPLSIGTEGQTLGQAKQRRIRKGKAAARGGARGLVGY